MTLLKAKDNRRGDWCIEYVIAGANNTKLKMWNDFLIKKFSV